MRIGKGNKFFALAFFLFLFRPPVYTQPVNATASSASLPNFPIIIRMDSRDTGFRQYISDVEGNRRRLAGIKRPPEELAEHLTIYQYTARKGDELLSVAARCNIPYSTLASLNRLSTAGLIEEGKTLLLPSCPGIFIPANTESELEKLIAAARLASEGSVELKINITGRAQTFHFFPGADFSPTERLFFLNSHFRFPLRAFRLTSSYGIRANPVTGNISMHQGLDLAAPEGTEVYAVADGVVTEIGNDPVYGIYIIITHRDRLTSVYGHLQRTETVLRSDVKSGTLIGRVGSTGQSTGPHLHFELRQNGRPLNPAGRLRP
ncbi:MAG: M23 family metallopeptidase [Treponema sp.]|jgi:murein DD-endopeptidase MepM/ murein hydrolase activator NlpD|nr:M23 family metallopeptidase [Treponema sp.]